MPISSYADRNRFLENMNIRLPAASRLTIVCACVLSAILAGSFAFAEQLATVSVQTRALGRQIPKDFVGFSLEVSTAGQGLARFVQGGASGPAQAEYALGTPGAPNLVFFQLMRNLGPGILRLGGNSHDNTCWDPPAAPHPDRCQGRLTTADFH